MKRTLLAVLGCFPLLLQAQEVMPLYSNGQLPNSKGNAFMPTLTVFRPVKDLSKGTAVIVCSGGSYGGRANSVEGIPAVKQLTEAGITAFLLDYRIPDSATMPNKTIAPVMDVQRAIQWVREHARSYPINPRKVGIMGFSAGGHLVSTAGTHFHHAYIDNPKGTSLRPDFMILVYPVISFADSLTHEGSRYNLLGDAITPENIREYSNELQVSHSTPPTYLVHGMDDQIVKVANSLYFHAALLQHKVPSRLFLYEKGYHGMGVHNPGAQVQWIDDCITWIKHL